MGNNDWTAGTPKSIDSIKYRFFWWKKMLPEEKLWVYGRHTHTIHKPRPWNYTLPFVFLTQGCWKSLRLILFAPTLQLKCWTAAATAGSQLISAPAGTTDWQDTRMWWLDIQDYFFLVDLNVHWLWYVGSGLVVQLSHCHNVTMCTNLSQSMLPQEEARGKAKNQASTRALAAKTCKKSKGWKDSPFTIRSQEVDLKDTDYYFSLDSRCCMWLLANRVSVLFPQFQPYYGWLPHFNKQQQQLRANRLHTQLTQHCEKNY